MARNVHFITGLLEPALLVCADMPEADRTFLQMAAVFAEWEVAGSPSAPRRHWPLPSSRRQAGSLPAPPRVAAATAGIRRDATARSAAGDAGHHSIA